MQRPPRHHHRHEAAGQLRFRTIREFYPFYKQQHRKLGTRVLHFLGTTAFLALSAAAVFTARPWVAAVGVVCAYLLAWVGHFFVEHNRPATFRYPLWSLACDFVMYFNILRGKEPWSINTE